MLPLHDVWEYEWVFVASRDVGARWARQIALKLCVLRYASCAAHVDAESPFECRG